MKQAAAVDSHVRLVLSVTSHILWLEIVEV